MSKCQNKYKCFFFKKKQNKLLCDTATVWFIKNRVALIIFSKLMSCFLCSLNKSRKASWNRFDVAGLCHEIALDYTGVADVV